MPSYLKEKGVWKDNEYEFEKLGTKLNDIYEKLCGLNEGKTCKYSIN